jgi:hypothetical protein
MAEALTNTDLQGALPLIARGKVRDLYEVDDKTLLFIATDRISAYDVILENVRFFVSDVRVVLHIGSANDCLFRVSRTREFFSHYAQRHGSRS